MTYMSSLLMVCCLGVYCVLDCFVFITFISHAMSVNIQQESAIHGGVFSVATDGDLYHTSTYDRCPRGMYVPLLLYVCITTA